MFFEHTSEIRKHFILSGKLVWLDYEDEQHCFSIIFNWLYMIIIFQDKFNYIFWKKINLCNSGYLEVRLWLLFKMFFMPKCIKMIFFYFLKIIFEISASKQSKT